MAIIKGQTGTKADRKAARAEYIGNALSDTGTGVLNALKTFGMSAVGDAINGISPKAADAVQKYTLGMIPHTSEAEYLANRPGAENKWLNRTHSAGSAAASQATGAMLTKAVPMAINAAAPYVSKVKGLLVHQPKITIQPGRDKVVPELGHVKNLDVYMGKKKILDQDAVNALTIVDKGDDAVVGNIFLPEELRGKGLTRKIYQAVADHTGKPLVPSSKYGLNQSEAGARVWRNTESFNPRKSVSKSFGAGDWYKNAAGERAYMPNDEYAQILKDAKANTRGYINDPRYKAVTENNEALARRLNSSTDFRAGSKEFAPGSTVHERRVELINRPTVVGNPVDLEKEILAGGNVAGRMNQQFSFFGNKVEPSTIEIPRLFNPKETAKAARHEFMHDVHPGVREYVTQVERSKLDRAFKPFDELAEIETKHNLEPWYLREPGERVTNSFDLATDLGIKKFNPYPGYEKFKPMLDNYSGNKAFVKEGLKLNTPRDYKRVWDLLSGTLIGGTGAAVGLNAAKGEPKQNKGGLLKRK